MKIALAQIASEIGNIEVNISRHIRAIEKAAAEGARLIVFPELSLTGYAPELAKPLAMSMRDIRLSIFQEASDNYAISIGLGLPIKTEDKPQIGMAIFEPGQATKLYGKQYLHEDELPDFSPGENYNGPIADRDDIALCVCFELSVDAHAAKACDMNASIYLASVAKTPSGVLSASTRFSELSKKNRFISLMCNCVGICEGQTAGGGSAVWNQKGELVHQFDGEQEALLVVDTESLTAETYLL